MKRSFLFIIVIILCAYNSLFAQMVDCNVFLSGRYLEAGISPNGAFGATVAAPPGYHANIHPQFPVVNICDSGLLIGPSLGFVADPDTDGFTVGTPPFYGDFITPGTPYEGWSISVDGLRADAWDNNNGEYTNGLTGSNTDYAASGRTVTGTWQGDFDGIDITQVAILDTSNLYITLRVTLTNTDTVPHNNIYYLRTADPDNQFSLDSDYATNAYILYQRPDTANASVVYTTGETIRKPYMALATKVANASVGCYGPWPLDSAADLGILYDLPDDMGYLAYGTGIEGDSDIYQDEAISLAFKIDHFSGTDSAADSVFDPHYGHFRPANSMTLTYFYVFAPFALSQALNPPVIDTTTGTDTTGGTDTTTAAVNHIKISKKITIFPNPTTNNLTVTGLNPGDNVTLYNMMGAQVNIGTANNNNYSLSTIPTGTYIILIKDAQGNVRKKQTISKL